MQHALKEIPHVIGMRESILDQAGRQFALQFLDQIAQKARVDIALQAARQAITQPLKADGKESHSGLSGMQAELSYGQWCLPLLISQNPAHALIDWQFEPQKPSFSDTTLKLQNITLASQFVGRRKEIRELATALQQRKQTQLLITGAGGQGKTALAGRLAQKLQQQGWLILAWSARPEHRWRDFIRHAESLLNDASQNHYISAWWQTEADKAAALLDLLVAQANGKLLVFFDNLESIQNPTTRELDENQAGTLQKTFNQLFGRNAFATWINAAQQRADNGVSLLLTSRWKIPHWQDSTHLALAQCSYNDYLALARQKPELQNLLQDRDKLRNVHNTLHGNARALEFFATAMRGASNEKEAAFLQKLAQANAESQADMALALIIKHRSPDEIALLNRLQAYTCSVAKEGVIKLSLVEPKLKDPIILLNNLLDVSLLEKTYADDMQCAEYQCSSQVRQWLSEQDNPPPTPYTLLRLNIMPICSNMSETHSPKPSPYIRHYKMLIKPPKPINSHLIRLSAISANKAFIKPFWKTGYPVFASPMTLKHVETP